MRATFAVAGPRWRRRAPLFPLLIATVLTVPLFIAVSGEQLGDATNGRVSSSPWDTGGKHEIRPGTHISAGISVSMSGAHPAATVLLHQATLQIPVACKGDDAVGFISVTLPDADYHLAASDGGWFPTSDAAAPLSYQGGGTAPDLCAGKPMHVLHGKAVGAVGSATILATDTTDPAVVRFHVTDAISSGATTDVNCSDPNQNTTQACTSVWSPATQPVTASPLVVRSVVTPTPTASSGGGGGGGTTTPKPTSGRLPVVGAPGSITVVTPRPTALVIRLPVSGGRAPGGAAAPVVLPVQSSGSQRPTPAPSSSGVAGVTNVPPIGPGALLPVPVLAPANLSPSTGLLPWDWFLGLAAADLILLVLVIVRHQRHARRPEP